MSSSLPLVIEHYRRLRDDAVASQARLRPEVEAARRTLETLKSYRDEQLNRSRDTTGAIGSVQRLMLQTRFTGKLEDAIRLQAERVAELDDRLEQCRIKVLAQQQRLKAIESLEQRRIDEATRRQARRDQSDSDERAALRARPTT